jgi:RNA polymerase sigma factor (sigma-70 family)
MPSAASHPVLLALRRAAEDHLAASLPDSELLRQFAEGQDEAAFLTLMRRHGPMVLDVCRALLPNEADAEDAFQATFLLLARKAGSIRKTSSVGSWLHGVAYRTARQAQAEYTRRNRHERRAARREETSADELLWSEARSFLQEELAQLSDGYRAPLVLCYLQGKTQDEAAAELGLSKSTLKTRLERGRELLRGRLVRRGLGSAGVLLVAAWPAAAETGLPAALLRATSRAAQAVAAAEARQVSPLIAALADDRFEERERATRELAALGESALPALHKALRSDLAETRSRARRLLEGLEHLARTPEGLQVTRAIEALENAGTPEARRVLEGLATGGPEAHRTREARAALKRWAHRSPR